MKCVLTCCLFMVYLSGCAHVPFSNRHSLNVTNPLMVNHRNEEHVWERVVDALHENLFTINRENRIAHYIETDYKTGSGALEPWHRDSQGVENLMESSLQSIRRKVIARVLPAENQQGYIVNIEVYKEIEENQGLIANSPGGATFTENRPLDRDLNDVVGQTRQSIWIPKGRDFRLESYLAQEIASKF